MIHMEFMTHLVLDYPIDWVWLSAISGNIFRHNFADTLNPLCPCSLETEDTEHYFLRWQNNLSFRTTLMNDLNNINTAIASLNSDDLRVILYRDESFNKETNCKILTASIKFIKDTQCFEKSLFSCIQIIIKLLQLISNIVVCRQAFIVNFLF